MVTSSQRIKNLIHSFGELTIKYVILQQKKGFSKYRIGV